MQSWDIFDTLLGRWEKDPKAIFRQVGTLMNFPDFQLRRVEAEHEAARLYGMTTSFENIYEVFMSRTGIDSSRAKSLMECELSLELQQTYPIMENVHELKDDDILVTDMYHSKEFIGKLLEINGISSNRPIYTTYGGKHFGTIWDTIKQDLGCLPTLHTGDNLFADVQKPNEYGIYTRHFEEFPLPGEKILLGNTSLSRFADLIRFLRLSNPYRNNPGRSLWYEQASINIPVLLLSSIYISNKFPSDHYIFCTREGENIKNIFEVLYPKKTAETFYCSRKTFIEATPSYQQYALGLIRPNTVMVDAHGSGRTANHFFQKIHTYPNQVFICGHRNNGSYPNYNYIVEMKSNVGYGAEIEDLNQDTEGSIIGISKKGKIERAKLLYDPTIIRMQKNCIARCVEELRAGFPLRPFNLGNPGLLQQLIEQLLHLIEPHKCEIHNFGIPHLNDWPNSWNNFELQPKTNKILYEKK